MSYSRRIAHLEETHAMLERELEKLTHTDAADYVIVELKKKKLHTKDLILELKRDEQMNHQGKEFK